ncbi:MAG: hypothetical protein OQK77_11365 [Psychromonas sp.]|nr:hypothetical protein [Psychromonas sp.]
MTKVTAMNPISRDMGKKIDSATVDSIMEKIEHDEIILNVAKELLKEVVKDAIDLENQEEKPNLLKVIEHINGQEWSDLFAESALRTVDLIKVYVSDRPLK